MQKDNLSLLVQGIYVFISGLQLLFIPNILLPMLGFDLTTEVWIKVLGLVSLALATLYFGIYRMGNHTIAKQYSIYGRLIAVVGFTFLVATGQAKSGLILFAAFDLATAVWTWMELKKVN